jgi:hypothetical protein
MAQVTIEEHGRLAWLEDKAQRVIEQSSQGDLLQVLRNNILLYGGDEVLLPMIEEDIKPLIERAIPWDMPSELWESEPNNCLAFVRTRGQSPNHC